MAVLYPSPEQSLAVSFAVRGLWLAELATFGQQERQQTPANVMSFMTLRMSDIREVSEAFPAGPNRYRVAVKFANGIEGSEYEAEVFLAKQGGRWVYESAIISKEKGLGPVPWIVEVRTNDSTEVLEKAPATLRAY